jgi:hypothetical protein
MLAATAALCAACSPAVGSPEWCKQFQAKMEANPNPFEALAKLTEEEKRGMTQCMTAAFQAPNQ